MGRQERVQFLQSIEEARSSKVLVYFCGDRPLANAQISDDAIRHMYDHLLHFRNSGAPPQKLDLILYALGGVMETPWKIVTMLREFCEELHVIIPYKAYSGATLIALGADKIWMTDKGELGPVDPSLFLRPGEGRQLPFLLPDLGVEDVASYLTFLKKRAAITDQSSLANCVQLLAQTLTPTLLGRIERIYSHIRLVADKLLTLSKPPLKKPVVRRIIKALTEKTYVHGHGIGRKEAKELGLQVEFLDGPVKNLVWSLLLDYEAELRLRTTDDARGYFLNIDEDVYTEADVVAVAIESVGMLHVYKCAFRLTQERRIPPQPVINVNIGLNLPPGSDPAQIPESAQQAIQQMILGVQPILQQQVAQEIRRQSPVEKITGGLIGGRWERVAP